MMFTRQELYGLSDELYAMTKQTESRRFDINLLEDNYQAVVEKLELNDTPKLRNLAWEIQKKIKAKKEKLDEWGKNT